MTKILALLIYYSFCLSWYGIFKASRYRKDVKTANPEKWLKNIKLSFVSSIATIIFIILFGFSMYSNEPMILLPIPAVLVLMSGYSIITFKGKFEYDLLLELEPEDYEFIYTAGLPNIVMDQYITNRRIVTKDGKCIDAGLFRFQGRGKGV